jgi:hypothetical protein
VKWQIEANTEAADAVVDGEILEEEGEEDEVVGKGEEVAGAPMRVENGRRRRIFWIWGSIWISG